MTGFDTYTWPDFLQGHVPQPPPLTDRQRKRLRVLNLIHPERRAEFFGPQDEDFAIINGYLNLNGERLFPFLVDPKSNDIGQTTGC